MTSRRVTRVLCAAQPRGMAASVEHLGDAAARHDAHAIALVGDLGGEQDSTEGYRAVFRALGELGIPTYWVPGPGDAPVADYLREAHNMETVFPQLRGVHGAVALSPNSQVVFAGQGGEVRDDVDGERDETSRLSYPRWEAEYRLKMLRDLDEHEIVLLFSTPLAHKGRGTPGSEALTELTGTYRARLAVTGGERGSGLLGRTLIVAPGSVADGHYAVADLHSHEVEMGELASAG